MVREDHRLSDTHLCRKWWRYTQGWRRSCWGTSRYIRRWSWWNVFQNLTFRSSWTCNHVLDNTVLVCMMTCLLCVHIVHFTHKETTVYFSLVIDRTSVSPGIVRTLRDGWRTLCLSLTKLDNIVQTIIIGPLTLSPLAFMPSISSTSGSQYSECVFLLFLQTYRETDRFFPNSGIQLPQHDRDQFHYRHVVFSGVSQLKSKVGNILTKVTTLRITPRGTQCIRDV